MAEKEEKSIAEEGEEDAVLNYTPPALKSLQEITQLDKEDESLNKYKQTLLGAVAIVGGTAHGFRPGFRPGLRPEFRPGI